MQNGVVILDGVFAMASAAVVLLMIFTAKEAVIPQGKFVPGYQLLFAGHASKAFQMKDLILGPHHKVVFAEGTAAFVTFGAEQSKLNARFLKEPKSKN